MTPDPRGTRPRSHRWQIGLLGAAIAAELLVLVAHPLFGLGPDRPRFASTPPALSFGAPPPPPARQRLLRLAATAERQPRATGRYAYVSRRTWDLGDQRAHGPADALRIREIRSWRATDGSGRVETTTITGDRSQTRTDPLPAAAPLPSLRGGQVALAHRLHLGYPSSRPLPDQFVTLTQLASLEPVDPSARASILRLLARIPGLVDSGSTVDRVGRRGVGISLISNAAPAIRYTLVFDTRTGGLLESDETLVGGSVPGAQQGDVIAYTTIRVAGAVSAVGAVPSPARAP